MIQKILWKRIKKTGNGHHITITKQEMKDHQLKKDQLIPILTEQNEEDK